MRYRKDIPQGGEREWEIAGVEKEIDLEWQEECLATDEVRNTILHLPYLLNRCG